MPTNDIQLTAGIRNNLLLLQITSEKLDRTQQRLATGNRINSALDGPVNFFAAKGLNRRADDLAQLKDSIGQSISTIKSADTGITAIDKLLEQAKGLITTAFGNLGNDSNSVNLRKSLSEQFDGLLRNIDKLATDSGYQGKNLLIGNGRRLDATSSSKSAVNALTGISGATATNVVRVDDYNLRVEGNGAISGNTGDIADAERLRGISDLEITGFASSSGFNFDDISIRLQGGAGKSKSFTITEGSETITQTFTQEQWEEAKAAGQVLRFSHSFASGSRVTFNVDFDAIEAVPDTAGVGTSIVEKAYDLRIDAENSTGAVVTRDGLSAFGQAKLANGENAFAFDSGTARIKVDERQIMQASKYSASVSSIYGTGSTAFTEVTFGGSIDEAAVVRMTAVASGAFNYVTNNFDSFDIAVTGSGGTSTYAGVTAGVGALSIAAGAAELGGNANVSLVVGLNYGELKYLATAPAATAGEADGTESFFNTQNLSAGVLAVNALGGFLRNGVTNVKVEFSGSVDNATAQLTDGFGGKHTLTGVDLTTATALSFTVEGGVNDGATIAFGVTAPVATGDQVVGGTFEYKVRGEFTGREARFDLQAGSEGQSATLETAQLVDSSDANNLTVQLNETNTSQIIVISQNVQTDGQGLAIDFSQNQWRDRADIDFALVTIEAAKIKLRSAASALDSGLDIITTRLDYTNEFINVLAEGANKLVAADQNEEGANLLQLQTRQQLGTISLSLANQAQQAILRLF